MVSSWLRLGSAFPRFEEHLILYDSGQARMTVGVRYSSEGGVNYV